MDIESLLNDEEILTTVKEARRIVKRRPVSDVFDKEGNQFVDLVMEGGGMLGIALVGYTYLLEEAGIRFLGVGGTSAGSINALLLAAVEDPGKPKSPKILFELCEKNFYDFVDGDSDAKDFVDCIVRGRGPVATTLKLTQVLDSLNRDLGLNPGGAFYSWITGILAREGVETLEKLQKRLNTVPDGLRNVETGEVLDTPAKVKARLALVAADVTTETKVVFPEMADLYFAKPAKENPATFVRASMSIPYFFEPLTICNLPQNPSQREKWRAKAGFDPKERGGLPKEVRFIDGGIMSNFPIALFHDTSKVPGRPTFGVKLGYDTRQNPTDGPIRLFLAIFNSARHCLDYDFISKNPDYKGLVCSIPVEEFNWLDFGMKDEQKAALFKAGVFAAGEFLDSFDWKNYKEIRKGIADATVAAK